MKKEEKFKNILVDNKVRLKRICSYYNSDVEDQKDMYQEILVNIWKSLDRFKGEASLNTWVYRIAVNTSLTFVGKKYKDMKLMVHSDTQNIQALFDEGLEESTDQDECLKQLQLELNLLSVIDKALISLLLEGLSMKEIAAVIGITEPNVKVKIHRIKTQLKLKLKGARNG